MTPESERALYCGRALRVSCAPKMKRGVSSSSTTGRTTPLRASLPPLQPLRRLPPEDPLRTRWKRARQGWRETSSSFSTARGVLPLSRGRRRSGVVLRAVSRGRPAPGTPGELPGRSSRGRSGEARSVQGEHPHPLRTPRIS